MSSFECPPTPPTLPEGEAAITPPPKSPPRITSDEDTSRDQNTSNNTPTNDADKNSSTRPKSPEPSCAICLGKLENMSHTNACSHKFCFVCLVEWTKVKPVCPLCKRQISSIIHNIRDGNSERYQLPPPPPRENRDIFIEAHRPDYFEVIRRFQYGGGAPDPHQVMRDILRERQEFLRMNELRRTMDSWRDQLPTLLPAGIPISRPQGSRITASGWNRRRGPATSDFRRDIYRRNLYVDPESLSDITGRVRDCSPAWYRTNPAQTHRLVPWLNRELNALLEGQHEHQSPYVTQKIMTWIERFEIQSPEFHEKLLPFLSNRTDHFQHEFYNYARSVYDLIGYDRNATYTEQATQAVVVSSESDQDDVILVDEFRRTASTATSSPFQATSEAEQQTAPSSPQIDREATNKSPTTTVENPYEMGPSTSTGIGSGSAPLQRLVIPDSDDSDDASTHDANATTVGGGDDVEIVGYVKPRHERTPVIVDLSSEDEKHLIDGGENNASSDVPKRPDNETINIISSSNESVQLDNPITDRQQRDSIDVVGDNPLDEDEEQDIRTREIRAIEMKARAEFKRILNAERFAKRRMKLILPERYSKRRFKSYKEDFNRQKQRLSTNAPTTIDNNETIALDASVQEIFQQENDDVFTEIPGAIVVDTATPSIEATPPAAIHVVSDEPLPKSKDKGKGKGKGKSSNRIAKGPTTNLLPDRPIVISDENIVTDKTEKKRNKSKKRKRSKVDVESNSSGYSDDDWERSSKRSKRKKKKNKRSKQRSDSTEFLNLKSSSFSKKKQKSKPRLSSISSDADAGGAEDDGVEMELKKSTAKKKKRSRCSSLSSDDEMPLASRWKISMIKKNRNTTLSQNSVPSNATKTSPSSSDNEHQQLQTSEDLRMKIQRSREKKQEQQQQIQNRSKSKFFTDDSDDDGNNESEGKMIKSVVYKVVNE